MSFFAAKDLCVRVDGFALRGASFQLDRGEYLCVLGPSGTGKSVLLDAIAGFHDVEAGRIVLDGEDISRTPPERRGIGVVYQNHALFPHLNVFGNIAYGLRVRERDGARVRRRVEEMAESLGLSRTLDKRPGSLSGGEQQRTALARALAVRPRLLLMDEPFSSLDPPMRRDLRRVVRDVVGEFGITVVHAAHDLDDLWTLADKALVIEDGRVKAFGGVNAVLGPPCVPFLRRAEGVRVIAGIVLERRDGVSSVEAGGVRLATSDAARAGETVRLVIRPEDVTLYTEKPAGASARNVLESRVTGIHRAGETVLIGLRSERLEFNALLTRDAVENLSLAAEKKIFATIKAVHLNIV